MEKIPMFSEQPYHKLIDLIKFETSRSSGPGGQGVNKTESRVQAVLDVEEAIDVLGLEEKQALALIDAFPSGQIEAASQETRSQYQNKEIAIKQILARLEEVLNPPPERKVSPKEPKKVKEKRHQEKKFRSEKKQWRQKPEY